jgi:hypothetical protein
MGLRDSLRSWWHEGDVQPDPGQAAEIARREQYWYQNPIGFKAQVRWVEPRERSGRVGAYDSLGGGLGVYGSVPVPFHGEFNDWGTFEVQQGRFVFIGQHCTRIIPFNKVVHVTWFIDGSGVQIHHEGARGGLVTVAGPVRAAVCGALGIAVS